MSKLSTPTNRVGRVYRHWKVQKLIGWSPSKRGKNYRWLCRCKKCDNTSVIHTNQLVSGKSKTCSKCSRRIHGKPRGTYQSWKSMLERSRWHRNYITRGIRVCDGLRKFVDFLAVMGHRPTGMTLDRKDNDGHYSCGHCGECVANGWSLNCRWATAVEQSNNMKSNRQFTLGGETKTVAEWCRLRGISRSTVASRVRRGSTMQEALKDV